MESLHKNNTWELVELPNSEKFVHSKWLFKIEFRTPEVEEAMCKKMLVAKGYNQILGFDFIDVFSPIVKHGSIQVLLGIVAMYDFELER